MENRIDQAGKKEMTARPVFIAMFVSALLAATTGFFLSSDAITSKYIASFSSLVAQIVPCVSVMAQNAIDPSRAQITWALQWTCFPIILMIWLWSGPVWSKEMKQAILKETSESSSIGKRRLVLILTVFALGSVILSDFGVVDLWSFFRGSIFYGVPSKMPLILRVPFTSNFGMALYAWFVPIAEAFCYWMFLLLVVNFKSYFYLPEPVPKS